MLDIVKGGCASWIEGAHRPGRRGGKVLAAWTIGNRTNKNVNPKLYQCTFKIAAIGLSILAIICWNEVLNTTVIWMDTRMIFEMGFVLNLPM